MRAEIKNNLDNPGQLERLYRGNKTTFKREFNLIYPDIQETVTAQIWNARINFENEKISWGTSKELIFVLDEKYSHCFSSLPGFSYLH